MILNKKYAHPQLIPSKQNDSTCFLPFIATNPDSHMPGFDKIFLELTKSIQLYKDCVSHGIFTPEQFTTNLGNILADPSTPIEPLCARLGTRTQALWTPDDPNTLK